MAFEIVPFEVDLNVLFCVKIDLEFVFASHNRKEVINVLFVGVFDTKVVYDKCEGDLTDLVYEQTIGVFSLDIIVFVEVFDQVVEGDLLWLF